MLTYRGRYNLLTPFVFVIFLIFLEINEDVENYGKLFYLPILYFYYWVYYVDLEYLDQLWRGLSYCNESFNSVFD